MDGPGKASDPRVLKPNGESPARGESWDPLRALEIGDAWLRPPLPPPGAPPARQPALAARCEPQCPMVALQEEIRAERPENCGPGCPPLAQLAGLIEPAQRPQEAGPALATPSQWACAVAMPERINTEVMRRSKHRASMPTARHRSRTEVDLMIDRLHALCDHQQGGNLSKGRAKGMRALPVLANWTV